MLYKKSVRIISIFILSIMTLFIGISSLPEMGTIFFYPLSREVQEKIIVSGKYDFDRLEGKDHIIYYKNQNRDYAMHVSSSIEKNLKYIVEDFKYIPDHKLSVLVYSDYNEMARKMKLGNGVPAVGAYYSGTISILNNLDSKNSSIDMDSVILHELTHYILDYKCSGNIPVWFTEGVALYEEYKVYNQHWPVNRNNKYYNYKQLQNYFYELDEISAYSQSFMIINYIVDNFKMNSVKEIVKQLGMGRSIEQAVEKVLNISIEDLFKRSAVYGLIDSSRAKSKYSVNIN